MRQARARESQPEKGSTRSRVIEALAREDLGGARHALAGEKSTAALQGAAASRLAALTAMPAYTAYAP